MSDPVIEYMAYARERGCWWAAKYPYLKQDILATAMLALVQALNKRVPEDPKAYISKCIEGAVADLLESNYLIRIPREEIQRRKRAEESLDMLPRAVFGEDYEIQKLQYSPAPWAKLHVEDIKNLLRLTTRERRILELRMQDYTNEEIGIEFELSEPTIRKILIQLRGRYLNLLRMTDLLPPKDFDD